MNEQEIIHYALHNLQHEIDIKAEWKDAAEKENIDGKLKLHMKHHPPVEFFAEVKKELRAIHLDKIMRNAMTRKPYIVIAARIFPKVKEQLRDERINYLDASGNMFVYTDGLYINIAGKRTIDTFKTRGNRAFTKTGLQVIYQFLINDAWINRTYRDIAEHTGTGLGNINNIFTGLKQEGFLLQLTKTEHQLDNKAKLLERWVYEYEKKLKPSLAMGTYRFLKEDDFYNWKGIPLRNSKTYWGGEPAGALFTNYLRPEELTIYTTEERTDLIKNYRLVPDLQGNVKVYKKFWKYDEVNDNTVHPLLAYADLITKGDRRCTETAQKIYDEYLQNKF